MKFFFYKVSSSMPLSYLLSILIFDIRTLLTSQTHVLIVYTYLNFLQT